MTALGLMLLHTGFFFHILYPNVMQNSASLVDTDFHPTALIITICLYISSLIFILRRYKQMLRLLKSSFFYLSLPFLALASTAWSAEPDLTPRRASLFIISTAAALYIGDRFSIHQIGNLLITLLLIETICPIFLYPLAPQLVIDPFFGDAWRALTEQKNVFGSLMCQAVLFFYLIKPERYAAARYVLVLAAAVLLFLSKASSAVLVMCLILLSLPILFVMRLTKKQLVAVLPSLMLLVATLAGLLIRYQDLAFGILGKDSTYTGRSGIWELVLVSISRRPLLGYGYNAYWVGLKGESLNVILASGWLVPNAHNGFLDLTLELGLVGLVIFLITFFMTAKDAFHYLRSSNETNTLWPMVFLLFMFLHSFAESDLVNHNVLTFFLFIAVSRALAKWRKASNSAPTSASLTEEPSPVYV
jgi:O-antigen ligase